MKYVFALSAMAALSCAVEPVRPSAVPVPRAFTVASPAQHLSVGGRVQLTAWRLTDSGLRVAVTPGWRSTHPEIAFVDASGVVHARSAGTARLDATLGDDTADVTVRVLAAEARTLELFPSDLHEAPRGLMPQLRAWAAFSDGTRRDVTAEVEWNAVGATFLREPGHLRLDTQGDLQITARLGTAEGVKRLRVLPASTVSLRLELERMGLRPGERSGLRVIATLTDGTSRNVTGEAVVSSLDAAVATVTDQSVIAVSQGQTFLAAEYEGRRTEVEVSVVRHQVVSLVSALPHADLPAGRTAHAQVIAAFDDGSVRDVSSLVRWTNSTPAVASVNEGVIRALAQGSTRLEASFGDRQVAITISVHPPVLESVSVTLPTMRSTRLTVGQTATFAVLGRFSDGAELNVSPLATMASSAATSLTLSNDLLEVTAMSAGTGTVQVELGGQQVAVPFTVTSERLARVQVLMAPDAAGRLIAMGTYADGVSADVSELCTWTSSDLDAVQVSSIPGQRGLVGKLHGEAVVQAVVLEHTAELVLAR